MPDVACSTPGRLRARKQFAQLFGHGHGPPGVHGGAGVFRVPFGVQELALGIVYSVHEGNGRAADFADPDLHLEQVVVMRRTAVAATGFPHRKHHAAGLDVRVALAEASDQGAARPFEDVQVFAVIQIAHGVGFAIGDPMFEPCFCVRGGSVMHLLYPCGLRGRLRPRLAGWAALVLWLALLGGCTSVPPTLPAPDEPLAQALPPVYTEELERDSALQAAALRPTAQQLGSWKALAPALSRSLAYAAGRDGDEIAVAHGDVAVTWEDVRRTLALLEELLPRLDAEPELLGQYFRWYRLTQGADFSGYYEPLLKASLKPSGTYRYPLYAKPAGLRTLDLGDFEKRLIGQRVQYRVEQGQAVPYYSRAEIEAGALRGRGLELAWTADPLDAYFLHIQGSGRLVLADGTEQHIAFAATNGRPYTGLGRLLQDRGELSAPISYEAVRGWLKDHPDEAGALMRRNERYVFFRLADEGPIGGMGQLLTPWVSLAADPNLIPLGAPVVFSVEAPFPSGMRVLHGLGFAQDTGAAIRGRRLDLFCGSGDAAVYTAGRLNTPGTAWMLLAR